MSKTFSTNDVSSHSKPDSLWIIVDGDIYDLTKFQDDHPGKQHSTRPSLLSSPHLAPICLRKDKLNKTIIRRQEDPAAGRRQRCLKAVLEIPQRGYPKEVQGPAADRQPRLQTQGRGQAGRRAHACRRAQGSCGKEACYSQGPRGRRGAGAVRRADSLLGPELVPGCKFASPISSISSSVSSATCVAGLC